MSSIEQNNNKHMASTISHLNDELDQDNGEWKSVTKNKKKTNKVKNNIKPSNYSNLVNTKTPYTNQLNNKNEEVHNDINNNEQIEDIINRDNNEKEMKELKFQNKWYIWIHEVDSKDWDLKSYKIVHTIENLWDFWQFYNHTYLLNQWKYNFFVMKSNSHPTWEHSTNRNGGTCSIRIDISQSIEIIEQLSILLVNESLTDEINDINGISFAAKGNWCVIKIWNRDYKNNISNQIPSYLRKIYPAISIKYKDNIPEY